MKRLLRLISTKSTIIALLITGIVLLCPVNPISVAATSCDSSIVSASNHDAGGTNCSTAHPEFESHNIIPTTIFGYSALLLFAILTFFVVFSRRLLLLLDNVYSAKLNYFQRRYRIDIKPKLETLFHRWLNLLGGSIALSI